MTSVSVQGERAVREMLRDYTNPKLPKRLQDATKAGADTFKAPLKAAARPLSKRLAKSLSVRKAKRERPATIITFRPKVAFFRHFIIGGTSDHGPRSASALAFQGKSGFVVTKRVRGVKAHPIVDQVAGRFEAQAYRAIDQSLDRSETA